MNTNILFNVMIAWAEGMLDRQACFRGSKVIRAFEDAPKPGCMFVVVDLTANGPVEDSAQPMLCPLPGSGNRIETVAQEEWQVTYSISVFRNLHDEHGKPIAYAMDAASLLQRSLKCPDVMAAMFAPHGFSYFNASSITPLREVVNEKWEERAQFTVQLRYLTCEILCEDVMAPCIIGCDGEETSCESAEPEVAEDCAA